MPPSKKAVHHIALRADPALRAGPDLRAVLVGEAQVGVAGIGVMKIMRIIWEVKYN